MRGHFERDRARPFTVEYFFGQTRTAQMYAGTRTADLRAAREGQGVWEVAVELVEF